jgi:hypothetical protein
MSFPFPQQQYISTNSVENVITSVNSNPYFIGSMMLLLNLGGRHLASGLTPEQDKFFQQPWFRRLLIFVVFFIGTRNIISSFFMSIVFILLVGYLFNDSSSLYLFNPSVEKKEIAEVPKVEQKTGPVYTGLTIEEMEIHKRLSDKMERTKKEEDVKAPVAENIQNQITMAYSNIMGRF